MFGLLVGVLFGSALRASEVLPIPSVDDAESFLLNGWRADRPNLLVFKDPFCPYCLKAAPQLEHLVGYNIFVFWAPILGEKSKLRVKEYFKCQRPVSQKIIDALVARVSPNCGDQIKQASLVKNVTYVDAYNINSVPSFYLQGQKVSLSQLLKYQQTKTAVMGIHPDWQKFSALQYLPGWQANNQVLLVAAQDHLHLDRWIKTYKPEFLIADVKQLESKVGFFNCAHNAEKKCLAQKQQNYKKQKALFYLLFDGLIPQNRSVVINTQGQISELK